MPADEHERLTYFVTQAHTQGRKVRFWATPDQSGPARERLWRTLKRAGVDYLNTDDLPGLSAFLLESGN